MPVRALKRFIDSEAKGGLILMATAALALAFENSSLAYIYDQLLTLPVSVNIGALSIDKPLLLWINDGLMAVFFFLVGLEIKREVIEGQLSSKEQIILPAIGAVGGMAIPAVIFLSVTGIDSNLANGWAIPAATDIAFALGVLALLGNRIPTAIKTLLLAIAIFDDLGAIIIIAAFYTADLSFPSLAGAAVAIAGLIALNRAGVLRIAPYIMVGVVLWVFVLKSGVHATLAGVVLALAIPLRAGDQASPLRAVEHSLHPYVAYGVLPAFAFANAGVSLDGFSLSSLLEPLPLGIAAGLLVGKQIGVFGSIVLAVKFGIARRPDGVTWLQLYGLSCLAGIGFTMSLFIGTLAFAGPELMAQVRYGVLTGSLISALLGYAVLRWICDGKTSTASA